MHPLLLLIILVLVLAGASWLKRLPAARRGPLVRKMLLYGGGLALVALVVTGRLNPLLALIGGAVPLAFRALGALNALNALKQTGQRYSRARSGAAPQRSVVRSRYLEMSLDHETGQVSGTVVAGPRAGEPLSHMDLSALLTLHQHYTSADSQSAALLEAYLDQEHSNWRASAAPGGSGEAPETTGMTEVEAREILGVAPGATNEEIRDAHRRLMQRLHPDRGGSTYLAAKVNQAKRILERENA